MKIVVTGSLGNISKPLAQELVQKGYSVTVVSSKAERIKDIEALSAKPAIGSVKDVHFMTETFMDADAVYCMNPPDFTAPDQIVYYQNIGTCYAKAIEKSGIRRVVYLSSYGAHLPSGTGFITGSYKTEKILDAVPGISLTHIRPTYFYYNLLGFIPMIKALSYMGSVYGGSDKLAMVSPKDIALAVAEEISALNNVKKVRYVTSDDRACNEIASVLGNAIGLPDLKWNILPKEQVKQSLMSAGTPKNAAENLIELGQAVHTSILREDYELNKPEFGKIPLEDFAKEFAAIYHQN